MKTIKISFLILLSMACSLTVLHAQKTNADIKKMIEAKDFTFKAQTVTPARGGFSQFNHLTQDYDVTIKKDSIITFLPFFGTAQVAPYNPRNTGIDFSSTSFDYKITATKKGWEITIKPNDVYDVQRLYFTIYNDGTADLYVINSTRDNISYRGYIK